MKARLASLVVLLLLLLRPAPAAQACTPPVGGLPRYEMADYAAAAPVIFRGTVRSIEQGNVWDVAAIRVDRYFKGSGVMDVVVDGFGPGSMCRTPVTAGDDLIVFARPVEGESGRFAAFYLSQFDAAVAATAANVAALEAALGLDPVTPQAPAPPGGALEPLPADESSAPVAVTLLLILVCALGLALVIAAAAVVFVLVRRRR